MDRNPAIAAQEEVNKWNLIKAQIDSDDMDEKCVLDTLEGETNMYELLLSIEEEIAEHESTAEAVDMRIKQLSARKTRLLNTASKLRTIVLAAMDKAGIKTINGDLATLTVKPTPRKLIVHEETFIPSDFFKPQDPKLDKKALKEAIENGGSFNGVELDNGGITLQIRRA